MDKLLAPEIRLRIIEEILFDDTCSDGSKQSSLRALRRCCRSWSEAPLPHLFSRPRVSLWGPFGLKRLHSISQTPRLARQVRELVIRINFDIADPHPAPFGKANQRRASSGFWQDQEESSEGRLRKFLPSTLKAIRRRGLTVTDFSRPSVSKGSAIDELFAQFDACARATIENNLGREKYTATLGLPPLLIQLASVLSEVFSSLPYLTTLTISTQPQLDFINAFAYGYALPFTPVFGTFNSISDLITTTILRGLIASKAVIDSLLIKAGSPYALSRFVSEFEKTDELQRSVSDPISTLSTASSALLPLWIPKSKFSRLKSLTVLYDEGFQHPSDTEIAHRVARRSIDWTQSLATILSLTTSLTTLHVGRLESDYTNRPTHLFLLDVPILTSAPSRDTFRPLPFHLSSLTLSVFTSSFHNFVALLSAVDHGDCEHTTSTSSTTSSPSSTGTTTLKHLKFPSGLRLMTSSLPNLFIHLRTRLNLTTFTLGEGDYIDPVQRFECRRINDTRPGTSVPFTTSNITTAATSNSSATAVSAAPTNETNGGSKNTMTADTIPYSQRVEQWISHKREHLSDDPHEDLTPTGPASVWAKLSDESLKVLSLDN